MFGICEALQVVGVDPQEAILENLALRRRKNCIVTNLVTNLQIV